MIVLESLADARVNLKKGDLEKLLSLMEEKKLIALVDHDVEHPYIQYKGKFYSLFTIYELVGTL